MNNAGPLFGSTLELPVEAPADVPRLCTLVRSAGTAGRALYPFGGATMLSIGFTPTRPGIAIDMKQLSRVVDYPARDMTITVQAGITLGALRAILEAERQQLPIDVPLPDRATLGGAIAANASGHRRYGLGTLRDYVIGIRFVNDDGEEVKGGGRVVKNVAGYDFMKLLTGSFGTLGLITEATLKLKPLAEAAAVVMLPIADADLERYCELAHVTRTRPVAIEWLSAARHVLPDLNAGPSEMGILLMAFEDNAPAVRWQVEQWKSELPESARGMLICLQNEECRRVHDALRDFAWSPEANITFKANLLPSSLARFCRLIRAQAPTALLRAHAGNGIVVGHIPGMDLTSARTRLADWSALAAEARGNLMITRCPPDWKPQLPIWGRGTPDRLIMKSIKARLDPRQRFNPGRFVDGI